MNLNLFYTIPNKDKFEKSLSGDLGTIYLPNIIGIGEGYEK
jgi:hypothetical protein